MTTMVAATAEAATLTLATDLSGSNPLVKLPEFARAAGTFAARHVSTLELGDMVNIRSFGARDVGNLRDGSLQINRTMRPERAAAQVSSLIAGIPAAGVPPQPSTNIVAFFKFGSFDCASGEHILVITDAIESSAYVDSAAFLSGKAKLPTPEADLLKGCKVTFYGLGVGQEGPTVEVIRAAWREWFSKAGADFTAVIP